MESNKVVMWTTVDSEIKNLVLRLISSKGICLSEYVRQLVLEDLDKRSLITERVKRELAFAKEGKSQP
jgi:hypothetical protein